MIDPKKVLVMIPCGDGKVHSSCAGGIMAAGSAGLFGNIVFLNGCADISLARNTLVNRFFLETEFEWLVFIDSDIGFSSDDFRFLMNDGDENANSWSWTLSVSGDAMIVCADYARKVAEPAIVRGGLGFARIHRSVFTKLLEKSQEIEKETGQPMIGFYQNQDKEHAHFFPVGPTTHGKWMGEDLGFLMQCQIAGIVPRYETRTNLHHFGQDVWIYKDTLELRGELTRSVTDK